MAPLQLPVEVKDQMSITEKNLFSLLNDYGLLWFTSVGVTNYAKAASFPLAQNNVFILWVNNQQYHRIPFVDNLQMREIDKTVQVYVNHCMQCTKVTNRRQHLLQRHHIGRGLGHGKFGGNLLVVLLPT